MSSGVSRELSTVFGATLKSVKNFLTRQGSHSGSLFFFFILCCADNINTPLWFPLRKLKNATQLRHIWYELLNKKRGGSNDSRNSLGSILQQTQNCGTYSHQVTDVLEIIVANLKPPAADFTDIVLFLEQKAAFLKCVIKTKINIQRF